MLFDFFNLLDLGVHAFAFLNLVKEILEHGFQVLEFIGVEDGGFDEVFAGRVMLKCFASDDCDSFSQKEFEDCIGIFEIFESVLVVLHAHVAVTRVVIRGRENAFIAKDLLLAKGVHLLEISYCVLIMFLEREKLSSQLVAVNEEVEAELFPLFLLGFQNLITVDEVLD